MISNNISLIVIDVNDYLGKGLLHSLSLSFSSLPFILFIQFSLLVCVLIFRFDFRLFYRIHLNVIGFQRCRVVVTARKVMMMMMTIGRRKSWKLRTFVMWISKIRWAIVEINELRWELYRNWICFQKKTLKTSNCGFYCNEISPDSK